MIATVQQIKNMIKGVPPHTLVEILENEIVIVRGTRPSRIVKEKDIYTLINAGLSQSEVADRLGITRQLVFHHMKKLGTVP